MGRTWRPSLCEVCRREGRRTRVPRGQRLCADCQARVEWEGTAHPEAAAPQREGAAAEPSGRAPPVAQVAWALGLALGVTALVGAAASGVGAIGAFGRSSSAGTGGCMFGQLGTGLGDFFSGAILGVATLYLGLMAALLTLASLGVRAGSPRAPGALAVLTGLNGLLLLLPCGLSVLGLYLLAQEASPSASVVARTAQWVVLDLACWVCCACALASATKRHCSPKPREEALAEAAPGRAPP
jgi:hypothetical protein